MQIEEIKNYIKRNNLFQIQERKIYEYYDSLNNVIDDIVSYIKIYMDFGYPIDIKSSLFKEKYKFGKSNRFFNNGKFSEYYSDDKVPVILKVFNNVDEKPYCHYKIHNGNVFVYINFVDEDICKKLIYNELEKMINI